MKDIYKKIFISLSAFILVLSFMFTNLSIQNRSIYIRFNDNQFTSVNAGFRELALETLVILAYNIFISMGANHASDLVLLTFEEFSARYIDWYTDNTNEAQLKRANEGTEADWQSQQEMLDYLMATQQINELGQLQTNDAVLKKEYIQSIFNTSIRIFNDNLNFGNVVFKTYNYTNNKKMIVPEIDGINPYNNTFNSSAPYSGITSDNINYALLSFDYSKYNINLELVEKSTDIFRLKFNISNSNMNQTFYSKDLTSDQFNNINSMNKYLIFLRGGYYTGYNYQYYLLPIFSDKSFNYSINSLISLDRGDLFTTSNANSFSLIPTTDYFHKDDYISYNNTPGIPITNVTDKLDDSNYYVVPGTTVTTPTLPTPLPVEDEDDYIYNPTPTDPTVPDVDIGEVMPTTPDHETTPDHSTTVPIPGIGDALDGTFLKDMWVWFMSWLRASFETQSFYWDSAWGNLTTGINNLGAVVRDVGKNLRDALLFPINAIKATLEGFRADYNTKEADIADYFVIDLDITKNKFNLLIANITARIPCVNETFAAWQNIMAVQAHDLVSQVTVLGQTFTINTGQILQAFTGFGDLIKTAFRFVFWFIFLKGMRRRVTSFLGLVSTER